MREFQFLKILLLLVFMVNFANYLSSDGTTPHLPDNPEVNVFDVSDYGASGDGNTLDTQAIQKTINECYKAGGGIVYFPPGNYLSGTLEIKSHITLYLEAGAILWGSKNKKDYMMTNEFRFPDEECTDGFLLIGKNIQDFTLDGKGTIDGQGSAFWSKKTQPPYGYRRVPKKYRPHAMVYLKNSTDVTIKDISLRNSPTYTVWLLGCERIQVKGITIKNPYYSPNTDGLDIDCCRNVHISDCHIDAGDDCIALKSNNVALNEKRPCENIVVTNCTLSSDACGVRIGYEADAPIRNCTFSNLVMFDTDIGIDIVVVKDEPYLIKKGTPVERIIFSDVVMNNVKRPIFLWLGNVSSGDIKGKIENVLIQNVVATATNSCYIGGTPQKPLCGITLRNLRITLQGYMDCAEVEESKVWGRQRTPWGIFCRWVEDLKLQDIRIKWHSGPGKWTGHNIQIRQGSGNPQKAASGKWKSAIRCEDITDLEISGFFGRGFNTQFPAILLSDVNRAFIHNCTAAKGTRIFLGLEGKGTKKILLQNNNLGEATKKIKLGNKVNTNILTELDKDKDEEK